MCDVFTSSSATLAYIVVVFILTCPKIFCTSVIGVPLCRRCVARVCRNRCGVNGLSSSARSPINRMILSIASFFNTLWVFLSLTKRYSESSFLDARYCPKRSLLRAFRYTFLCLFPFPKTITSPFWKSTSCFLTVHKRFESFQGALFGVYINFFNKAHNVHLLFLKYLNLVDFMFKILYYIRIASTLGNIS